MDDQADAAVPPAIDVTIEPVRREWADALAAGDRAFEERFGLHVAPGWAGFPEVVPAIRQAAHRHDADPWGSHLFFADGVLVGLGGFKGEPADGTVEIGYAVAPGWQGRGIATAAALAMIQRARDAGVRTVVAHTLPEENPSTRVLRRTGFTWAGTTTEADGEEEQAVWRWELDLGT
jgi:RimJ/RimL family protein N-acetyltransferase